MNETSATSPPTEARVNARRLLHDRQLWARVWEHGRDHRRTMVLVAVLSLVSTVILLSYPLIYGWLVDDLAAGRGVSHLGLVVTAILLLTATHLGARTAQARYAARMYGRIGTQLQTRLFDRIQRQQPGFFKVSNTGAITARTVDEAAAATGVFRDTLEFVLGNVATVVLTLVALLVLDWRAPIAVVGLLVVLAPARRFERRFRQAAMEEFFATADLKSFTVERLNADGNLVMKMYGDPVREAETFRGRARSVWDVYLRLAVSRTAMSSAVMLGVNALCLLLLVAATAATDRGVSVGTIVAIIVYLRMLEGPLAGIADARLNIARDLIAFARVLEVLDALPEPTAPGLRSDEPIHGRLVFSRVSHTYPTRAELAVVPSLSLAAELSDENPPSLLDVSFEIGPGRMVALVGRSGAGKSTVAALAAGILEPSTGRVAIDGHRAHEIVRRPGQRAVAFVTQDTYLFHDTLRANVLYARQDASEQELLEACRAAGVHEFAWALPLRYETLVGEKGQRLSGGERQRIALARAILRDPALIILDEATAHMDTMTEASVQRALDDVFRDRSRLVIAHRLSTVRAADEILVLDGGVIAESGRHDELIEGGGLYADLYTTQLVGGVDQGDPSPRQVSGRA